MIVIRPPSSDLNRNTQKKRQKKIRETDDTSPLLILIAQKLYKALESPVHSGQGIILN